MCPRCILSMEASGWSIRLTSRVLRRDPSDHDPPVLFAAFRVRSRLPNFHSIQESGHIRVWSDHPLACLRARESILSRAAKNAQHVVLRGSELMLLQQFRDFLLQMLIGAAEIQQRLSLREGRTVWSA